MIRPVALMTIAAALSLAACSREPAEQTAEETVTQPAPVPASDLPKVDAPEPVASEAEPVNRAELPRTIPAPIRGRWGLVSPDCTSTLGDAKGLLTISADQLAFYESVAKLGAVKEAQDGRIRATFRFSGEGQSWTQDVVLDVQDGGKTLIRRDYGPDAMPGPMQYTRCSG